MISAPRPTDVNTGIRARSVVADVIIAGRIRRLPASTVASRISDLPRDFGRASVQATASAGEESTDHLTFQEAEEKIIREALDRCGWNRTKAAKHLNIPRHVLLYRMKTYQIEEDPSRHT
jgi:DNA-binding NtrC family response regulator